MEIEGFSVPGRFRPDPALKIDTFSKDFNCPAEHEVCKGTLRGVQIFQRHWGVADVCRNYSIA